ncbi:MAG: hypothetical protein B6I31_01565 [Desulfobacteraceae bacterium 4572_19]|nr:MAG: hypothetical protein B6I31_01565 [Desulfobacteraceae bacterium 4572_19]
MSYDKDYIDELIFCLNEQDMVKAKALLQFSGDISVQAQKMAIMTLGKTNNETAYPLLENLARVKIESQEVREQLYQIILDKSYGNHDLVVEYINNGDKENQILYIKVAGDLKISKAAPLLENIIISKAQPDLVKAAIKAIGTAGQKSSIPYLAKIIVSENNELKALAAQSLGEIGDAEAVEYLFHSLGGDPDTDKVIVNAIASIQDQYSIDKLTELLSSPMTDVRNIAMDQIIKIGPKAVPTLMNNLDKTDSDTMIHTLNTLGTIGDVTALPAIFKVINNQPSDSNIRYAVFEAMERLPSPKSAIILASGLNDPDEQVRMAAAKAIDNNISGVLVAGLKNVVSEGGKDATNAVAALINSQSDNVFNFLIDSDSFVKLATDHLSNKAPASTREHFLKTLRQKGKKELSEKIASSVKKPDKPQREKPLAFVVDDSKMMLRLAMGKLNNLGYDVQTFEYPAEAIKEIKKNKPDFLITDLNMPIINGLQLAKAARTLYPIDELPIMIFTTQKEFTGSGKSGTTIKIDNNSVRKFGINRLLHKPFTDDEFNLAISRLLKKV